MAIYRQTLPDKEYEAIDAWLSQFYNFQLRWMLDPAKRAACVKARQIGWSHTTAGCAVLWGAFHGELTTVVSKTELDSKEVLKKSERHAKILVSLGSKWATPIAANQTELHFPGGGRIMALASTGGRGFSGNVILDELAYHVHAEDTWDGTLPAARLGDFRVRVISTPNGIGNVYANVIRDIKKGILNYSLHEVSIEDAARDGFPVDMDGCWQDARGDSRLFDQMYRCNFLDNELQYIPSSLIDDASTDDLGQWPDTPGQVYYAGLDVGKNVDRTVLTILAKVGPLLVLKSIQVLKRTDQDALMSMVAKAFQDYNIRRLTVDATGMGEFPAESMIKRFGSSKVEAFKFTLQSKEEIATTLYMQFNDKKIRLPRTRLAGCSSDLVSQLREDLCSIKRLVTDAGNIRYDAPQTAQGHADSAWSLAMAVRSAVMAPTYATVNF